MTEVYHKTFWQNEHQMEVPFPLEEWPKRAKFLTIGNDGYTIFWSEKPVYEEVVEWNGVPKTVVDGFESHVTGSYMSIWERPF